MNCHQANQIGLVDYLDFLGFQPRKITRSNYWYLSPFRNEKNASFKVESNKNVWYDHGPWKGGKLVDFVMEFYQCTLSRALKEISFFLPPAGHPVSNAKPTVRWHYQDRLMIRDAVTAATIKIQTSKPIRDIALCRYLHKRRISKNIADKYCLEVEFTNAMKERIYRAIGFKNSVGGYELRNEYFKGSSSPKYHTFLDNKAKEITVFEGFFDFLSYQSLVENQDQPITNFLVLNSLSFFERSFPLMEMHREVHLYLDQDPTGRRCTRLAMQRSNRCKDESQLYKGYKDLNDWMINFGKPHDLKIQLTSAELATVLLATHPGKSRLNN
jgi:hypothetical protein